MSVIPALREGIRDTRKFGNRTYALLEEIRKEYGEPVFFYILGKEAKKYGNVVSLPPNKGPREGYIMPGFEQLKKDPALQEKFINAFIHAHGLPTAYRSRLRNYLQLAIDSAEELARYLGRDGKYSIRPEQFQEFEKFNKFIETIMEDEFGARPRKMAKPKTEKQRKRRIVRPEEILASQLSELEEEETPAPKFPEAEKTAKEPKIQTNPYSLTLEAQKLLGILNGLKYAGYSKEAVGSAVNDMLKHAEELAERGELETLGLYLWTAHLLREGRFEDAEKFLKKES